MVVQVDSFICFVVTIRTPICIWIIVLTRCIPSHSWQQTELMLVTPSFYTLCKSVEKKKCGHFKSSVPNWLLARWVLMDVGNRPKLPQQPHMRRFPEPQHFFAAGWQNQVFRPSRKGPICLLLIIILVYIQNLGLVAPGFEGSKSQKIILKGLRTLRTWGVAKYTSTLGGSRTLQEAPHRNLSSYSDAMVHLLLLLPKQL